MSKRVLLIDDDKDDGEIFQEALEDGYGHADFTHMDDGRTAISALVNKRIPLPDIIFLDVNMPMISGWDCLREIKKHDFLQHIPVIMFSTASHQREIDMALRMGAEIFFTKPHNYRELVYKLNALMGTLG